MGFLSRSVGFCRYRVTEPPPENFWTWAEEAMTSRRFLEPEGPPVPVVSGWVSIRDSFRPGLTLDDISFGEYLLASLRVDERRVPPAVLKKHCLLEEQRIMDERGLKHLPGRVRTEIRDRLHHKLLAKAFPVPKVHDLCWNVRTGQVLFFSCQERAQALLEDLFHATFGTRLLPLVPYTLAADVLRSPEDRQRLAGLRAEAWV